MLKNVEKKKMQTSICCGDIELCISLQSCRKLSIAPKFGFEVRTLVNGNQNKTRETFIKVNLPSLRCK